MRILGNILRKVWRRSFKEDGNATIEFVLVFPALITLFLMVFETGLVMIRGASLDRAVEVSMRQIRLGTLDPMTQENLRREICNSAGIIPDCMNAVRIEMRPVSKASWTLFSGVTTCVDRDEEIQPALDFEIGVQNEMMMVRVCAVFDPFFPTSGLAAGMEWDPSGAYSLVSLSAFVNER